MLRIGALPLLVSAAVATIAVGSYSPIAGSGPVPRVGSEVQDAAGSLHTRVQEGQQPADDDAGADKIAQAIAGEFGVTREEVLAHNDQGIGFGALFKLYKLARAQGITVDELLASIPTDANGEREFSFGQLRKALTVDQRAQYEAGPKNLGKLISGAGKDQGKTEPEGGESAATGRSRGNGRVPPGQAKKLGGP